MLQKRSISQRSFAESTGIEKGTLGNILARKSCFPLDRLPDACRVLHLAPGSKDRTDFERAIYLSHAPEEVRHLVDDLESQLAKSSEQFSLILAELRRLDIQLPESIRDL